jgi:anti-sigma regulatory factor (Ser/Thr protein kinase)
MPLPHRSYADARVLTPAGRLDHDNYEVFHTDLAALRQDVRRFVGAREPSDDLTAMLESARFYNAPNGLRTTVTISRSAMFPARFDALGRMNAFLEGFCREAALDREQCLRVNLVLEELFTNTVRHGHRGECDAPVWLFLSLELPTLRVTYEDTAPPFNPYAQVREASIEVPLEDRKVGGLGVLVTRELAASFDYAYLYGRNRIELALRQ